jgi:hypothetical protein
MPPLPAFGAPSPDESLEEGMCHAARNIEFPHLGAIAEWLAHKGVLAEPVPPDEWPDRQWPRDWDLNLCYQQLRERCTNTAWPSYRIAKQIEGALDEARRALVMSDPEARKWFPNLARSREEGRREFFAGIARATDGARAALDAGYRDEPIPALHDMLVGLCAYIACLLRDEIMRRILAGTVQASEGTAALAAVANFDNPQCFANAEWFAGQIARKEAS